MTRPSSEPLIVADEISERVRELAETVSSDFAGHDLVLIVVLKGALYFGADLLRAMTIPAIVDFARIRSYTSTERSEKTHWLIRPTEPLAGRDVLIVEDVLDTGNTAATVRAFAREAGAATVKVCTLLDKSDTRIVDIQADYVGFAIPNTFVVGYGLDLSQKYRELPDIHMLTHD